MVCIIFIALQVTTGIGSNPLAQMALQGNWERNAEMKAEHTLGTKVTI